MIKKAVGMFIFTGSATFGVEAAGFKVDRIFELTEDMREANALHFVKNRPDIPVMIPSEWENKDILLSLKNREQYDLLYSNTPCSSLSQINRNACADGKNNIHFYRVFETVRILQPKTFLIENAPTLITVGYPILKEMINQLSDLYNFTIIRDMAKNHGVPMMRQRTIVIGWHKKVFGKKIPVVEMKHMKLVFINNVIEDLINIPLNSENNHEIITNDEWSEFEQYCSYVKANQSVLISLVENFDKLKTSFNPAIFRIVDSLKKKIDSSQRYWDKSPFRPKLNSLAPSMTSVTRIIHPTLDRTLTVREYARLMGYPDTFKFYNECKTPIIQCIAQGVPKSFMKYAASEVKNALEGNSNYLTLPEKTCLIFQHHTKKQAQLFTKEEIFDKIDMLDIHPNLNSDLHVITK